MAVSYQDQELFVEVDDSALAESKPKRKPLSLVIS